MGTSLRGEITVPASSSLPKSRSSLSQINDSLDSIHDILSQVVRLSTVRIHGPKVIVTSPKLDSAEASESAAPWSWTAAEATSTETALLPFLTHLAAAKDDGEGLIFCLGPEGQAVTPSAARPMEGGHGGGVGMANSIDAASGRSPLHVAALNGSLSCVKILLQSGALVHLRDGLGHTALYYVGALSNTIYIYTEPLTAIQAARQGHEGIVDILVETGANLGGSDVEGGFVSLIFQKALHAHDERAIRIWRKAGAGMPIGGEEN